MERYPSPEPVDDRTRPYQPIDDPTVELRAMLTEDNIRPVTRAATGFGLRIPLAAPLALGAILVASTVAFGAGLVGPLHRDDSARTAVSTALPTEPFATASEPTLEPSEPVVEASPSVVPSDPAVEPTEPAVEPTAAPATKATPKPTPAPASAALGLSLANVGGKVKLTWTAYAGSGFAWYKIVRSTDAAAWWPLGSGDTLVAAISDQGVTSYLDPAPKGRTLYYQVFAVTADYSHLAASPLRLIALPAPTPAPTPAAPADMGGLNVTLNADGTYTFSWTPWTGSPFSYYKLVHGPWGSQPSYPAYPYWLASGDQGLSSWTGRLDPGDYAVRVQAVYNPGSVVIEAQTSTIRVTVSAPTPTAPPAPVAMSLAGSFQADGMHLSWNAFAGPGFEYYKIVRSATNPNPLYPENDGTALIAAISDPAEISFVDTNVASGDHWFYRVLVVNFDGGTNVLGISNVIEVTVP